MMGLVRLADILDEDGEDSVWPSDWRERLPPFADSHAEDSHRYIVVMRKIQLPRGTPIDGVERTLLDARLMASEELLDGLVGESLDGQFAGIVRRICAEEHVHEGLLVRTDPAPGAPEQPSIGASLETPSGLRVEVTWQ